MEFKNLFLEYFNMKLLFTSIKSDLYTLIAMWTIIVFSLLFKLLDLIPIIPTPVLIGMTFYTIIRTVRRFVWN